MIIETTILVDLLRGSQKARAFLNAFPLLQRSISSVTVAELVEGCRNRRELGVLDRELRLYGLVWVDTAQSQLADRWHRRFHLSKGVGFLDCLIGAAAFCTSSPLATLNDKHFRVLPGIAIVRPY